MSKRIYVTKGDSACTARITIPITKGTDTLLSSAAERAGSSKTELARTYLLLGLAGQAQ